MADDEVNDGGFVFRHHCPLALADNDVDITKALVVCKNHVILIILFGKRLRQAQVLAVFLVGVDQIALEKQLGQRQGHRRCGEFLRREARQLVAHRAVGQILREVLPLPRGEGEDRLLLLRGNVAAVQKRGQKRLVRRVDRRGAEQTPAPPAYLCIRAQKRVQRTAHRLTVDIHQRLCAAEQVRRALLIVGKVAFALCQVIHSVVVVAGDALARQRRRAGNLQKMAEYRVRRVLEVVGRDLAGHIKRNVALQSQHQFVEGAVEVVDDVQMQALFQQQRQPEHIFFGKIEIRRHVLHRHIAVQQHRLVRTGQDGRLKKVQLPLFHLLDAAVDVGGGKGEGQGRRFQLVEADGADVFVEVEAVKRLQERGNGAALSRRVGDGGRSAREPLHHRGIVGRFVRQRLRRDADERRHGRHALFVVKPPHKEARHVRAEFFRLGRGALTAADARKEGRVVADRLGKLRRADRQEGEQVVEICPQRLGIEQVQVGAGEERLAQRFLGQRPASLCRRGGKARNQTLQILPARRALAGAKTADRRGRKPAGPRQLPRRAVTALHLRG